MVNIDDKTAQASAPQIEGDHAGYWRGLVDPRVTGDPQQAQVTPPAGAAVIEAMQREEH